MNQHPVDIVIPVKDDQSGLDKTLRAIDQQIYPTDLIHIFVVDNNSTTPLTIDAGLSVKVTLLQCATPGSYAARNTALPQLTADYIAFTDADCLPVPTWLSAGITALSENPDVGLVVGQINTPLPADRPARSVELYQHFHAFPQRQYAEQAHFGATANVFTRKKVLADVGAFDASRASGGDREWGNRVHAAGWQVHYCAAAAMAHPPRTSWGAWWRKLVRVHEGELATVIQQQLPARSMLPKDVHAVIPPVGTVTRVLRGPAAELPRTAKARYAAGTTWARWLGTAARLKVAGGQLRAEQSQARYQHRGRVVPAPAVTERAD